MGGTSGALYAIFLNALANALPSPHLPTNVKFTTDLNISLTLATALPVALAELSLYTTARRGHKTLMDALIPFVETFASTLNFRQALEEARKGAEGTRELDAQLGRATYVGREGMEIERVPDPGALGVVSVLMGIADILEE
jgi:dihydroxyacetone kinase